MPIFSSDAFNGNYEYNKLVKEEAKIINEQLLKNNEAFILNLMLGNNKFEVKGVQYEFKALKFNAGKPDMGLLTLGRHLVNDLYALGRKVPLDIERLENLPIKVAGLDGAYGLDYRKIKGEFLTQEELDSQIEEIYPATKEGREQIKKEETKEEVQRNIDAKNAKIEKRNTLDVSNISSLDELKEEMGVEYISDFSETSQAAYNKYIELRNEAREEAKKEVDQYEKDRSDLFEKSIEQKNEDLEDTVAYNSTLLEDCLEKGDMKEFFDNVPGLDYKAYVSEKVNEYIISLYGSKITDNDFISCDLLDEGWDDEWGDTHEVKDVKKDLPDALIKAGINTPMLSKGSRTLREVIEKDKDALLKRAENLQRQNAEKEIKDHTAKFTEETQKGVSEINAKYEKAKVNETYVKGVNVAERMGVDNNFIGKAVTVIKNAQDKYNAMSGAGRFFSYINPFPNKYRAARKNIAGMINELATNTDVNKKDISNYVYGKSTEKPQLNVPAYDEVSGINVEFQNNKLQYGKEIIENNSLENSIDSKEKDKDVEFTKELGEKINNEPEIEENKNLPSENKKVEELENENKL